MSLGSVQEVKDWSINHSHYQISCVEHQPGFLQPSRRTNPSKIGQILLESKPCFTHLYIICCSLQELPVHHSHNIWYSQSYHTCFSLPHHRFYVINACLCFRERTWDAGTATLLCCSDEHKENNWQNAGPFNCMKPYFWLTVVDAAGSCAAIISAAPHSRHG